jgi:hypothetical protein
MAYEEHKAAVRQVIQTYTTMYDRMLALHSQFNRCEEMLLSAIGDEENGNVPAQHARALARQLAHESASPVVEAGGLIARLVNHLDEYNERI